MIDLFKRALEQRLPLLAEGGEAHNTALRLFNGFSEGLPGLTVDVYAHALVISNHTAAPESLAEAVRAALEFYPIHIPWLDAALVKARASADPEERKGTLVSGSALPRKVLEDGVWYALDLRLNQDASFYLDTRPLRAWLKANSRGLRALNTFAYTGSLGAACAAGGAGRVIQTDLNRRFLDLAKETYALNGLPVRRGDFLAEDFYRLTARLRASGELFDLVILDPPLFSATTAGTVKLEKEGERLINKLRPLVGQDGRLVVVNNALYLSGRDWLERLERLGAGGYLTLEELLPVPDDVRGQAATRASDPPADPAPFNHSTKIAILRVARK